MKAVYEMPKVSFEAFMADNAVMSACGYKFDCVKHGDNKKDDSYKRKDCEPTSVISTYLGMGGCTNNAGFAVLNDKQNSITGGQTFVVTGLDDDVHDDDYIMESTYGKNKTNLLGWLFISLTGTNGEYNTSGWHVNDDDDDDDDGTLDFKKPDSMFDGWHAWLTPVFRGTSTSGMGC